MHPITRNTGACWGPREERALALRPFGMTPLRGCGYSDLVFCGLSGYVGKVLLLGFAKYQILTTKYFFQALEAFGLVNVAWTVATICSGVASVVTVP